MDDSELRVVYWTDEEYTGRVTATVRSGHFSAQGAAWFDRDCIKSTFLTELRRYPLSSANPPTLEGGFWNGEKGLDQCHLRIVIKSHDSRGTLLVRVDVCSEVWKTPDADMQNTATVRFRTEYAALDRFVGEFNQVLDGTRDVAILKGIVA